MRKVALYTSGTLFGVGAVGHVVHIATGITIVIEGAAIPMGLSYLGALVTALLAGWMLVAARCY